MTESRREIPHVSDVVAANIVIKTAPEEVRGELFNVGTGTRYSVNDIARFIGGDDAHPARLGEARDTQADNSKAKRILNWEPKVKLRIG